MPAADSSVHHIQLTETMRFLRRKDLLLSKTASRIIHDHSHEQIIERIPDLRHEEHRSPGRFHHP